MDVAARRQSRRPCRSRRSATATRAASACCSAIALRRLRRRRRTLGAAALAMDRADRRLGRRRDACCSKSLPIRRTNDNIIAQWRPESRARGGRLGLLCLSAVLVLDAAVRSPDLAMRREFAHGPGRQAPRVSRSNSSPTCSPIRCRPPRSSAAIEATPGQIAYPSTYPYNDRRSIRVVFDLDPGSECLFGIACWC